MENADAQFQIKAMFSVIGAIFGVFYPIFVLRVRLFRTNKTTRSRELLILKGSEERC